MPAPRGRRPTQRCGGRPAGQEAWGGSRLRRHGGWRGHCCGRRSGCPAAPATEIGKVAKRQKTKGPKKGPAVAQSRAGSRPIPRGVTFQPQNQPLLSGPYIFFYQPSWGGHVHSSKTRQSAPKIRVLSPPLPRWRGRLVQFGVRE